MESALTLGGVTTPTMAPLIPTAIIAPFDLTTDALHGIAARMSWVDMNNSVATSGEEAMELSPQDRIPANQNTPRSSGSTTTVDASVGVSQSSPIPIVPLTRRGENIIGATFLDQWDVHHDHVHRVLDYWQNFRADPSQGYQSDSSSEQRMSPPTHDYD